MDKLNLLIAKNQSLLSKSKCRVLYCGRAVNIVKNDFHKQYGVFSSYWDEWLFQAEDMNNMLTENVLNTTAFLNELKDYYFEFTSKKKLTRADKKYHKEVISLTEGKIDEQKTLLRDIDFRISLHKQFTEKLVQIEEMEKLSDE